ncbi:MAG: YvrJ family protein [Thermanaeromonas sp.]|uniref:YvrJ family protein n=1 Tax=Thermanaeromonas sp. TaxID=2003697 RepID=UPI00243BD652|nr:YvrJ family protein [Thermanaeromonas sp.]MCG0277659.1 YvrJ family protein [Thermanaeromonas sp.]
MEELWTYMGNYGFPMVMAFYLLIRFEKKLDILTAAIDELVHILEQAKVVTS